MADMQRALWNQQQQALRQALTGGADLTRALELFLDRHARLHIRAVSQCGQPSFEEELWRELAVESTRIIPRGFELSIAWNLWHLARIKAKIH